MAEKKSVTHQLHVGKGHVGKVQVTVLAIFIKTFLLLSRTSGKAH